MFWNDDYELSVLPVFADVARSWTEGRLPILSPYSWVCGNLAGEFQYGTFSVFVNAAVIVIWKFPLTFAQQAAALSITHLFVLAAGAFLLARGRNFSTPLSIFVALIAALNGWIICWGATDWFGALSAFAWLPWAWWALEKSLATAPTSNAQRSTPNVQSTSALGVGRSTLDVRRLLRGAVWPAPFVYLVITGGFPYTVLMLALLIAWCSIKSLGQSKSLVSILPMLCGVALGAGLAAPAWMALLDYIQGSARQIHAATAHFQWLVPPCAWPGLILPAWTVDWADFSTRHLPHTATELACGSVAPAALIAAFISRGRLFVRQIKWELLLLLVLLMLCMVPTTGVFRWSFRWLPFFHVVLALCAAEALRALPRSALAALIALFLSGVGAIMMSMLHLEGSYAFPLTWIVLVLAVLWLALELMLTNESLRAWTPVSVTFVALFATYLCIPPNCGVPKYNFDQQLLHAAPLDAQRLYLSIYPPAEHTYRIEKKPAPVGQIVRPGSTSMWAGLRFVNGYSPILAAGVARAFGFAIHGEIDADMGNYLLGDQSRVLEELGIDGLIVAQEIATDPLSPHWQLVFSNDEGRVFQRRGAPLPRARCVNWIDSRPDHEFVTATVSRVIDSRNCVELDVDVPGGGGSALLEFARPYFRGYAARIGDKRLAVTSYRTLIPLVEVPAGLHGHLVLSYRPWWLVYGGGLSIFCAGLFFAGVLAAAITRGRPQTTAAGDGGSCNRAAN